VPCTHRALALIALLAVVACRGTDPFVEAQQVVPPSAGAVVSEHPLATEVGRRVLDVGGNAADAAVATALALAVVYPQAGNLGGGGFALWVPAKGAATTLDFRERAPSGYSQDLYLGADGEVVTERSLTTPLAVGVPGSPAGLFELYRRHGSGRLSFAQLCEGAVALAEEGFFVDAWLARDLASDGSRALLTHDPGAATLFFPGGQPLAEGARLVQPALAATLRRLAARGREGFYRGEVAEALVADLREADRRAGFVAGERLMSLADLASYTVAERAPLEGSFAGRRILSMGPPSSGGVVLLQVLAILEGLPLQHQRNLRRERVALGLAAPEASANPLAADGPGLDARAVHWWIEAFRCAFADRAEHLGDPDYVDVPVTELLAPAWIAERRVSIGERADLTVGALVRAPAEGSGETTHLSVVDREGNAVSLTTTLNDTFGSGIFVDEAGFLLNNELDDFSIKAGTPNMFGLVGGAANQLAPGRRPLSSMTPTVVLGPAGGVEIVLGAPGGPRIISAVTQVLLRMLAYGQSLDEAIRAPRLHQQWRPEETRFERGWPSALLTTLARDHAQPLREPERRGFASVQAIHVAPDGQVEALSDPRRGGTASIQGQPGARPAVP
jgi:gamma-glutamyltranspeptidase/glutathione hydrolase